jgi:hypothetical protein
MIATNDITRRPALRLVKEPSLTARLQQRIEVLEGQQNAIVQCLMYLCAECEIQAGFDLQGMKDSLRAKNWPTHPHVDKHGRKTLRWICNELDAAQNVRAARRRDDEG